MRCTTRRISLPQRSRKMGAYIVCLYLTYETDFGFNYEGAITLSSKVTRNSQVHGIQETPYSQSHISSSI